MNKYGNDNLEELLKIDIRSLYGSVASGKIEQEFTSKHLVYAAKEQKVE